MKKYIWILLFLMMLTSRAKAEVCPAAMANFCGDAGGDVGGQYTMTFKKFEISTDGVNFVTIGEGSSAINIADINVGSSFGAFVSNTSIPAGTYTHMRVTLNRQQTLKGRSDDRDSGAGELYYYTTDDKGMVGPFNVAGEAAGWDDATDQPIGGDSVYESVAFNMPDDAADNASAGETITLTSTEMIVTMTLPTALVVGQDSDQTLIFKPHTESMIGFADVGGGNFIFMPMPPRQDVE